MCFIPSMLPIRNKQQFCHRCLSMDTSPLKRVFVLSTVLDRLNNCLGSFTAKLPKTWSMFERRLHFHLEIEMADIDREKTLTLARFNWLLQTIFGPGCIECSIKMGMRYSSVLFDHTSVDTSSYIAGFHIGPLYWSISIKALRQGRHWVWGLTHRRAIIKEETITINRDRVYNQACRLSHDIHVASHYLQRLIIFLNWSLKLSFPTVLLNL